MTTAIPPEYAPFVQQLVAERRFLNEQEVLAEGLRLLQAREEVRREVEKGLRQLDEGLGIPAEDVYAKIDARICDKERRLRTESAPD